jgi:hypothetical protein
MAYLNHAHCLPPFGPYDDPARAIFDRVIAAVRARTPAYAHHTVFEMDATFGDLLPEIAEITDEISHR